MPQYRYVIVASDGRSWLLQGDEQYDQNADNNYVLPRLLQDGWKPVRERSLAARESGYALILLKQWPAISDNDIPF
jgi:hypothetical protein